MSRKINVASPLVILHGDEMAQVAFERILETFVTAPLDIDLVEIDLTAENRLATNGQAVIDAIEALNRHGVGVKNAGMTVNREQLDALLAERPELDRASLHPLATKSPNGAIRKGIGGNITREDIEFRNLRVERPDWIGRDIEVDTMDDGGIKDSHNALADATGMVKLLFVGESGDPVELHRREVHKGDPWLLATNDLEDVKAWAHRFFQRAIDEKRDIYLGLKDTVIAGYDGVMRAAIEDIFRADYQAKAEELGLEYHYELIDAQAARIVSNPPERALWGVPDNTSGRKLYKLVEQLKRHGIPDRKAQVSISRMSAGGGDQYGSYNAPAEEDGILKVVVDGEEKHARHVKKGDPILLMSNDRAAIKDWVLQVFRDASRKDKEVYFGLKREYMDYDEVFSDVITEARRELAKADTPPPSFMIMRPSRQLIKMITDPPRNALYPAQNLDGDIFSDISAALGGSLATASSIIESKNGTMLFEAPHGTAHDLYLKYLESDGKEAHFNSSALIYAVGNALETLAERENNAELGDYATRLKAALIDTIGDGIVTGDLKGKTTEPDKETVVDMQGFLDAVAQRLAA
ncbi:NADP-dependent isocitrate dehydrogenase [Halomonas elongata]|uniref:NADP-dependent isocitrate dehydrogenase n=1 Tax=Halomonas elongata (strain ATCC 33173 / DSM 2581 / NBRC 15536 / NCIMB 2198 / 1H9) TaxID=768066 RepID=E1V5I1_HALED|nr:NADP-dependent isocitrate dehydrogenase [Halomonas elongata]MBW5799989.1 NADP-dependent isocitrate dehydrogenase [Halomonas elongata]WBF16876.1 NADP-dependent isocitrate dehydrogenase [Halomonas elongata]WPU45707.1 NADP-dependent isocitrate dehydrogenase [Halomonas elongata DSM 2581]CBV43136.1 probable oxidative decarboxylase (homolog to isocitrate dehydrogenase) [Halomonas elongata DSM 2581]